jgi:hypothetical protein
MYEFTVKMKNQQTRLSLPTGLFLKGEPSLPVAS